MCVFLLYFQKRCIQNRVSQCYVKKSAEYVSLLNIRGILQLWLRIWCEKTGKKMGDIGTEKSTNLKFCQYEVKVARAVRDVIEAVLQTAQLHISLR